MKKLIFTLTIILVSISQKVYCSEYEREFAQLKEASYSDATKLFDLGSKLIKESKLFDDPFIRSKVYYYYGNFYFYQRNFSKSRQFFKASIAMNARTTKEQLKYYYLALSHRIYLDYEQFSSSDVLDRLKKVKNYAQRDDCYENICDITNLIGIILQDSGKTSEAVKAYYQALNLATNHKLGYYPEVFLNNIGLIKLEKGDLPGAKEDFEKGIKMASLDRETRVLNHLRMNLCVTLIREKKINEATTYFNRIAFYARTNKLPVELGHNYLNMAEAYLQEEDFNRSVIYYDSAITTFQINQIKDDLNVAILNKAGCLLQMKKTNAAETALDACALFFQNGPTTEGKKQFYWIRYRLKTQQKKLQSALLDLEEYTTLNESLNQDFNMSRIKEIEHDLSLERKELELQKERLERSKLTKENTQQRYWIVSLILLTILIIVIIYLILYTRYSKNSRTQQHLFSQQLIKQSEEQRKHIAMDLHDDLGQSLSYIRTKIQTELQESAFKSNLTEEVNSIISKTRSISHQLYPSALEQVGIKRAIIQLLNTTETSTGIICSYEMEDELDPLSIDIQTHLYRILQECVTNSIKHGSPSAIKISIEKAQSKLTITYRDNGKGIQGNFSSKGIGLNSIQERADIIGFIVKIEGKNKGFTLVLESKQKM